MKKRLYSLDFFRGIAIIMVIIFHRLIYDWPGSEFFFTDPKGFLKIPWFTAIMFFAGMGGIISIISGVVTAYSTHNRMTTGKANKKNDYICWSFLFFMVSISRLYQKISI